MSSFDFDHTTTSFNLTNALRMAEASRLAYEKTWPEVEKRTREWGFSKFNFFDTGNTEAFLASGDQMAILAFRGTQELEDWVTDLKAKLVEEPGGRVHRGFKEGLDFIWADVVAAIKDHGVQGRKLWVTGHSLGAALATLAVNRLTDDQTDVAGFYTFGSPRVGDKAFAGRFNSANKDRTFRFVNNEDIVTRLPPCLMGYRHIGQNRYFDNKGKLHGGAGLLKMLFDQWESMTMRYSQQDKSLAAKYPNALEDHKIEHYINLIRRNLGLSRPGPDESAVQPFVDYLNEDKKRKDSW